MRLRTREREEPGINLTPLIDVVFLLVIFFMVSTTFQRETRLDIELPEASAERAEERRTLDIMVDAQGRYFIDGQELVNRDLATLKRALQEAIGAGERPVVLRADARTPHEAVVRAMDAAGQLGISRLSIATVRPAEGGG